MIGLRYQLNFHENILFILHILSIILPRVSDCTEL
jgi:hypothetical protein